MLFFYLSLSNSVPSSLVEVSASGEDSSYLGTKRGVGGGGEKDKERSVVDVVQCSLLPRLQRTASCCPIVTHCIMAAPGAHVHHNSEWTDRQITR